MNEDYRLTLHRKGWRPDGKGGYFKPENLAARVSDAESKPNPIPPLVESPRDETRVLAKPRVRITRLSTRPLDRDNLYASVKSLLDGLHKAGLIPGDSEAQIDLEVRQEITTKNKTGTLIEITEENR